VGQAQRLHKHWYGHKNIAAGWQSSGSLYLQKLCQPAAVLWGQHQFARLSCMQHIPYATRQYGQRPPANATDSACSTLETS
jgi:hypothetical protein